MKILVTGGTGFLGSHLARRLAADGHTVTVLKRAASSTDRLEGVDVHYVEGDVADAASIRRAVDGQDVVIHAAAGVVGRGTRPESYAINVDGARNVVASCIEAQVTRLVHVSSVAAIGVPRDRTPADEGFAFNLESSKLYYHLSKRRAEDLVHEGASRGLDTVIVNPATLWGPFGGVYRGSDFVRLIRGSGRVQVSPGGVCVVHVEDVVGGIVSAMERGASGDRYILGGDNLTYREWISKITKALGVDPRVIAVPRIATQMLASAIRPATSIHPRFHALYLRAFLAGRCAFYDSGKAKVELGYRPRSFEAILDECLEFLGR